ncbi:MAG TPA: peptidoglycan-binding domain-containing protein [Actinomycetes bacterium]|nr:peptidoglycan-binding domain-containing protein [Actinomycetes bacterium]
MTARLRSVHFAADPLLDACLSGTATLHEGMAEAAVAKVQQALMELGYTLRNHGPDGLFGRETGEAVAAFNADIGLAADGVVGSRTIAALDNRVTAERSAPLEDPAGTAVLSPLPPPSASSTAAAAATAAEYASRAVDAALAQAAGGAHFLAGAGGAKPGGTEGTRLRPAGVTVTSARTDPVDPAVFAARCEVHGPHVCAGRFNARNGGIAGGRPAASTDTDLIVYLAGLASLPEERWKPFFQFFSPRRFEGGVLGSQLVWGEDCRAKQHFDGVGLVNWCLEQAVEARYPITFDIATWATDASGTDAVALTEPPRKGDILLRAMDRAFTHIGFLVGDHDPGVPADLGHVVLAEQEGVGVVRRRFSPSGWSVRRRPSAALLHD